MKKILFAIVIVFTISLKANAQFDGFVSSWDDNDNRDGINAFAISLPSQHYYDNNTPAPLSSGLFVLTVLGAGYALRKKSK